MATWNGQDDNLRFRCGGCGKQATIDIDLSNSEDKDKLWIWLDTHSASGGDYINVPCDIEKVPVKHRTDYQHKKMIQKYDNSVRKYLLSMGEFKDTY